MLLRLQIVSTGVFFVLPVDQSLSLDINSTLFNNQDDFLGSISYPGKMDLEPNRMAIQNAQYITTSTRLRQFPVLMYVGAFPWKQVTFRFTIENNLINYTLMIDATIIVNQLKTLRLMDLLDPAGYSEVVFNTPADRQAYMLATATETPGKYPAIYFPFKNDGAYKVIEAAGVVMVDQGNYNAATNTPQLHDNVGIGYRPAGAVAGWYFSITVNGTNDYGNGPVNALAEQYMVYNGAAWVQSTTIEGLGSADYPDISFPVSQYMNAWEIDAGGTGYFRSDPAGAPVNNTNIPAFCLPYIFRRIAAYFGFKTTGLWLDKEQSSRVLLMSNIPGSELIEADLSYYMPDVLVSDFIKEMRTELGLLIDFDETRKIMICQSLQDLFTTDKTVDLRGRQLVGYRETGTLPDAYTIEQGIDDNDGAFTDQDKLNLPVLEIGDPASAITVTDVALIAVATKMLTEAQPYVTTPANWRIPWIKMPVFGATPMDQISSLAYADRNKFKLRLLYYHGMQPNEAGYNYPYASSDNVDMNGVILTPFTLSLNAGGTAFLSVQQYFSFMLNSKPAEFDFKLRPADLTGITADSRILIRDFNQATVACFLDQMSADIRNDQEIMVKLTLYPRIMPDNLAQVITAIAPPPPPPPYDNGLVYLRLTSSNQVVTHTTEPPPPQTTTTADFTLSFYSDAAGTIPKNVIGLVVRISVALTHNTILQSTANYNISCDGTSVQVESQAPTSQNIQDGSGDENVWTYAVVGSALYTVLT